MKLHVLSIRDRQMDGFSRPFFVPAIGLGKRQFGDEVNRQAEDNPIWKHPEDYELYLLGTWDEETGLFEGEKGGPKQLDLATNLRVNPK